MKLFLGIDLGSTTSKAILIDESESVVGRGITNTRSSYDVAVEVAREEAVTDALLRLVVAHVPSCEADVASAFRIERDLFRLGRLRQRCQGVAASARSGDSKLAGCTDSLMGHLEEEGESLFSAESRDQGTFFRDVVGARVHAIVEDACASWNVDYDLVTGVYDRAILEAENETTVLSFGEALARALDRAGVNGQAREAALRAAEKVSKEPPRIASLVGTGYGRQRLPFPKENIRSEILCHGLGAHSMFPTTRTVLDIGGQDTKAIQVDEKGLVTAFQMNDRCAAGCGRYLGYIADELSLGLHELGPLALQGTRPCRITSTCTVFPGLELRDLLAVGEKRENILAGLHRAIITRAMSLLARSGGVHGDMTFTGGVAKNAAAVAALHELTTRHYGPTVIHVHPDSIYTGALGAALFAKRGVPPDLQDQRDQKHAKECSTCLT
ncbi:MAG: benzoyl-CoA reductase subunit A [Deltaproteobacteria bacterium]|nr:benzoyl-CoA reductase subunit A [Deltaproteobacteria bacterium]